MKTYYKPGSWNVICDVCGLQHKSDELKLRWDGLMVCSKDYETRHPQDLIRIPREDPSVAWARPDSSDVGFVCNFVNSQGIAGIGVAGCSRCGSVNP